VSKVMIILDRIPASCDFQCPCFDRDFRCCQVNGRTTVTQGIIKPDWCPIVEVKEEKNENHI
jgi:hypothetical protein